MILAEFGYATQFFLLLPMGDELVFKGMGG